jgi:putative oxidoreductase
MDVGRLAARAVIGGLFIGHGTQKLFGWFDGPGIPGTEGMMTALGMHPTKPNAYAAALTETVGGAMLVAGAATPLAASALTGTMITAIRKVHLANGPWAAKGGWEYNAVLIAAVLALTDSGPGVISLDNALGLRLTGSRWALAALALGAAASTAAIASGQKQAPAVTAAPAGAGSEVAAATGETAGDPVTTTE